MVTGHCPGRVPPFGYPWINACLRLPMAFRSLSRPSSAISALASTLRSFSLDLASFRSRPLLRLFQDRAARASFRCFPLCSFQGALPVRFQPASNRPFDRSILWPVKNFRTESSLTRFLKTIQKSSEAIRTFSPLAFASVDPRPRQFLAASRRILPFLRSRFRARFSGCRSLPASPSAFALRLPASLSLRSTWDSLGFRFHSPALAFLLLLSPRLSP